MIRLPQGFKITSIDPVDVRFILSKEEMKNIDENKFPANYFTICSDDNQLYVYNNLNEPSTETGKFKLATADEIVARQNGDLTLHNEITTLDNSLSGIAKTGNTNYLTQQEGDLLIMDCNP